MKISLLLRDIDKKYMNSADVVVIVKHVHIYTYFYFHFGDLINSAYQLCIFNAIEMS